MDHTILSTVVVRVLFLVTMGILETLTGFSLSHFISIGGSSGATFPHTTGCGLRAEPSLAQA